MFFYLINFNYNSSCSSVFPWTQPVTVVVVSPVPLHIEQLDPPLHVSVTVFVPLQFGKVTVSVILVVPVPGHFVLVRVLMLCTVAAASTVIKFIVFVFSSHFAIIIVVSLIVWC